MIEIMNKTPLYITYADMYTDQHATDAVYQTLDSDDGDSWSECSLVRTKFRSPLRYNVLIPTLLFRGNTGKES